MKIQHILIAVVVAAIWGVNFVVVKTGLEELPPFLYGAGRFVIALLPFAFIKKPNVNWSLIVGIGLFLGVFKYALMFMGMYVGTSAGLASLISQSQVFFTIALSMIVFKTSVQTHQIVGMILAFGGIAILALNVDTSSTFIGAMLILGSGLAWGISNILFQKAGNVDMFALTIWTSLIPPIPMFLLAVSADSPQGVYDTVSMLSSVGLLCLLFTACISTWVGVTLWGVLTRTYDAAQVAPYSLLIPIFGLLSAWIVLGEEFSSVTLFACGIIFVGLIVNQWTPEFKKKIFSDKSLPKADPEIILDKAA